MKIMASKPIDSWQIDGKKWKQCQISFSCTPKSLWMVTASMKLWHLLFRWKAITNIDRIHHFADTDLYSQSYGFSSSHVWMSELDHKEYWERHYKEYIWISSNEVNDTGAYYKEWSKPERKTPTQYTSIYIWNLERR